MSTAKRYVVETLNRGHWTRVFESTREGIAQHKANEIREEVAAQGKRTEVRVVEVESFR